MASISRLFSVNFMTISVIFLLFPPNGVNGIPYQELDAMLSALRSKGYNLFGNAIMTSDIRYEILAGTFFTFFAPTDASLFSLDMTATASVYIMALRYHVVNGRYSNSDLRSFPSGSSLRTLVPNQEIHIAGKRSTEYYIIAADGIDIVVPGLFYGRSVAVHGLNGILNHRSSIGSNNAPPPVILSDNQSFPPKTNGADDNIDSSSPRSEPRLDGISPGPSPKSQDLTSLTPMQQSPVPNSPDSASPEHGLPVTHSAPPYGEDFPPNSQTPVPSPKDVRSSSEGSDTYSDSDGYSRLMLPELKNFHQSNEEELHIDSGYFGENSEMLPFQKEDEIQALAPEFFSPSDGEGVQCPNDETVKDYDLHFGFRRGYPHPRQHLMDL